MEQKKCKGCGNELNNSTTDVRRNKKYCSIQCYRDATKQFYSKDVRGDNNKMSPLRNVLNAIVLCLVILIVEIGAIGLLGNSGRIKSTTNYNYLVNHDIRIEDMPESEDVLSDPKIVESNKL